MRVAVDARELAGRPTGVGRYLSELLAEWAASPEARACTFLLYTHADPVWLPPALAPAVRRLAGRGGTLWEQRALARALAADRPDVLFAPGYTAPLAVAAPVVLAVHDVSFLAHPEWFGRREALRRRLVSTWAARRARRVLTLSEFSRREIVSRMRLPPARVQVIPPGIRRRGTRRGDREPLVLFVGSLFARRHVDRLIEAFVEVRRRVPSARLEIVGENRTRPPVDFAALVARHRLDEAVALRAYVEDDVLEALYARAQIFAFLSEYEGFGLTPLEALAAGAVPVVLDTPVAREVLGPAARFVPAGGGAGAVADALAGLLADAPARAALLAEAPAVLARYDWARAAADTLRVLQEAAGG